ncbi:small G protein signaling modulator 1 [Colossoma macropomum]|uniref:small G protein signaling modulator 1 n=1 Tax=Colossoma macropomum TaxID=42526 RepID=UPI0018641CA7|nr:small G protein signaling modulator 1 [Colossoma macropomum]
MATTEAETRQKLVRNVKKEVKQIMEEAVTRKFVHEDSSHIVSFCAAVEACVLHGLKRRAAGFLRSNKVAALFTKVGKSFPPAEELCRKAQELEQLLESKRSQTLSCDSSRKLPKLPGLSPQSVRHLWIRTALIEKVLDKIVLYLVENSSKFYEKEAVLMDPVDGPILASLLVGPCALEYTKMKTADHFWTDPSADELVQRHRIHSAHYRQDSPTKRPALCIQKRHSSSSMDERPSPSPSARDYVESLHQNSRATLLFGKNNVLVQPRDDMEAIPGYLSLHQTADAMTLKWTPNQLMNGSMGDLDYEKSVYWDYAMTIRLEEIVYLHCHQQVDSGGTVVLVSQDGIQRPPLRFPRGGHLLQFLSCLENGLLPHGQLDPPLWSQRGKGKVFPKLKKRGPQGSMDSVSDKEEDEATDYVFRIVFPNSQSEFVAVTQSSNPLGGTTLLSRSSSLFPAIGRQQSPRLQTVVVPKRCCSFPNEPSSPTGSPAGSPSSPNSAPELLEQGANMWQPRKSSCSSCSQGSFSDGAPPNGCNHERAPLKLLCDNMKNQIISRAFYGWLAYCRHLSTVRIHLSALVNHTIVEPDVPSDAYGGLTAEVWNRFLQDCRAYDEKELLRLVYFGGVEPSLRKEVWPFLLGHYQFGMSESERKEVDEQVRACYEQTMSEWLGCEAIVRQREKEQHAVALAKCSSGASIDSSSQRMLHRDSTISNESSQSCSSDRQRDARLQSDSSSSTQVFESVEDVDQIETEPKSEEAKRVHKVSNGAPHNGSASPDSGHPSSRNFSVASGHSDSLSTEDSGVQELNAKASGQTQPAPTASQTVALDTDSNRSQGSQMKGANGSEVDEALQQGSDKESTEKTDGSLKDKEGKVSGSAGVDTEKLDNGEASQMEDTRCLDERSRASIAGTEAERASKSQLATEEREKSRVVKASDALEEKMLTSSAEKEEASKDSETVKMPLEPTPESQKDVTSKKMLASEAEMARLHQMGARPKMEEARRVRKEESSVKEVPKEEASRKKAVMQSPPVVEETVVPVVFEAFSTRKMSETPSDESPSAIEMEEIPSARVSVAWDRQPRTQGKSATVPVLDLRADGGGSQGSPEGTESVLSDEPQMESLYPQFDSLAVTGDKNGATSPVSSIGTTYSQELLDMYTLNLHRIEKDVQRCDRNYWYFTPANLEKLRNIMCSYIWQHLEIGYVQGMCDLLAPLLVILDDEALAFSCFTELMKRMNQNFPHGGAMDTHFANMRSLIQILDSELFELMHQNGDYTHFYFCYRWFLLDFKRELVYDDVFAVWETIWAAKYASSGHFVLFIALALVELYRDIILENNMDFTDIIKFFNEMAEHHNVKQVLALARDLVSKVQTLIENK